MAVVLFSMDIQPFIFFSQINSEVVKERDSEVIFLGRSDKIRELTRCTRPRDCRYPHRQDRLPNLGEKLSDGAF